MRTLQDKVALITGAGGGIGRAIALRLARAGAHLYLADINAAAASETARQVGELGASAKVWCGDLAEQSAVESLAASVQPLFGRLDILVNNAGIGWYGPTVKMADADWDRLLAINLEAPILLTRRLLKPLLSRPEAHVVNIASICGFVCSGRFAAYHVSKFGLVGFSEALRAEYCRQGLGVTAVCPGPVLTDLYRAAGCGYADRETPSPPAWLCTTADRVAAATVRSISRNRALVLVGLAAHLLYYTKRLAPGIFYAAHAIGRTKNQRAKLARPATTSPPHSKAA